MTEATREQHDRELSVSEHDGDRAPRVPHLRIYSHSTLFYWWPVWLVGFVLAGVTWANGTTLPIGNHDVVIHANKNLGVFFAMTILLVILITNVTMRGLSSALLIMTMIAGTLFLAYMDWWDVILSWFGAVALYADGTFYFAFSAVLCVLWLLTVFIFDRLSYFDVQPGQVTQEFLFGAGQRSYDTNNMVVEKHRDDFFRHWVLGLGSGDLYILTSGGKKDTLIIPNVLFVGTKIERLQRLIAVEPAG